MSVWNVLLDPKKKPRNDRDSRKPEKSDCSDKTSKLVQEGKSLKGEILDLKYLNN